MRFNRRTILSGVIAATSMLLSYPAAAQSGFPTKPITIMVPAGAGGPTDTVARLIAESMGRTLGQTILVENVGGAGGTLGMARASKAAADGYTLAIWHIAQATAPALYESLKYDVLNDFDHLGRITDVPMTLVSKPTLAAGNVTELLTWIRSNSANATYGHAGIGSASHLCMLMLMKELGIQMNGIPYRGTGPAMNDLLSNQFDVMCDQTTNTTNQIKEGKIKGFAVTTKSRVSSLPICRRSRRTRSRVSKCRRGTRCGRRRDCRRMRPTRSSPHFRQPSGMPKSSSALRALVPSRSRPIWRRRRRSRPTLPPKCRAGAPLSRQQGPRQTEGKLKGKLNCTSQAAWHALPTSDHS